MSTYLYDEGLIEKFKSWTDTTKIQVFGPNEITRMLEVVADTNKDEPITLPLITLNRSRGYNIREGGTSKRSLSYDGLTISAEQETSDVLNAIPISLSYQLDVYAKFAEEADILMKNLIFNMINYPSFYITVPDAGEYSARITINDSVDDTSSIQERFIEGNFTRLSLSFSIDDAWLWDLRKLHNVDVDLIMDDIYEAKYDPYFPPKFDGNED